MYIIIIIQLYNDYNMNNRIHNTYIAEYIWLGGNGEIRSKTRVLRDIDLIGRAYYGKCDVDNIPLWNYDGSSTNQADPDKNTEVVLKPCVIFDDPLQSSCINVNINMNVNTKHIILYYLVLCDTYDINMKPLSTNHRHNAAINIFTEKSVNHFRPWFGLEQEYFMISDQFTNAIRLSNGEYYCGTQISNIQRNIVNEHLNACLSAKIKIAGVNAEVSQNQWEFQIGPSEGIKAADDLIMARFLLERVAEKYNVKISYTPKISADINGSGCHTNFSTVQTRNKLNADTTSGINVIYSYITKLENKHAEHIAVYGKDNEKRLTGIHETSSIQTFSFGVGTRNTSIRIPNQVAKSDCGYFEDRRPAANIDPYQVTGIMFQTCCG